MFKRITATVLSQVFAAVTFSGCAAVESQNLTDNIDRDPIPVYSSFVNGETQAVAQFSTQLLHQLYAENETVVYSPLSILYALAMTANGAEGETLAQMEQVMGLSVDQLNSYLYSTVNLLPSDEGYDFDIANSVWIKDDEEKFEVNQQFLQTVKNYYLAQIFKSEFDNDTLKDINNWVAQQTNGQIQNILDRIDPDAVMYLVNALNFEAQWQEQYEEYSVQDGQFTRSDGTVQDAQFMYGSEYGYLSDENTAGFIKYYKDHTYAFVALKPQQTDISSYVQSLNGEKITTLLENISHEKVITSIPKFETTFDTEMSAIFKALGMTDAFDYRLADFSSRGTAQAEGGNLCIGRIIHKAFIRVAEQGTQAGASTVVEMITEGAMLEETPPKEVYLDQPFVYMVIDTQNNLPLFMGTVCEIE